VTDHHWNLKGGLWAARVMGNELNRQFGYVLDTDLLDAGNFTDLTYEKWFLGSLGRTVTTGYVSPEDFVIPMPAFDTELEVVSPDKNLDISGAFEDVVFNYDVLNWKDYYNNDVYESILWGNRPLTRIINKDSDNGLKVLIIRDSFSLATAPYFSLLFQETDLIDLRSEHGNFDGSVKTFIKEEEPDLVIYLNYISLSEETFLIQ
jgi:hypothetical protein